MYRCLIVDDEPRICLGLQELLSWADLGFSTCDMIHSAEEAIKVHRQEPYQLILTDIKMPGMDGLEMIRQIREYDSNVRFIIISGYGEFEYARKAISYNVNNYLLKPVDELKLEQDVRQIRMDLDRTKNEEMAVLSTKRLLLSDYMQECLDNCSFTKMNRLCAIGGLDETMFPLIFLFVYTKTESTKSDQLFSFIRASNSNKIRLFFPVKLQTAAVCLFLDARVSEAGSHNYRTDIYRFCQQLQQGQINANIIASLPMLTALDLPECVEKIMQQYRISLTRHDEVESLIFLDQILYKDIEFARIIDYIKRHLCEEITIKSLATFFYLNQVYLGRIFKKATGMKFNDYINDQRINLAADLLKNSDNKVSDICHQVGYHDIVYFYKKFKEIKGKLPSDFRSIDRDQRLLS